MPKRRSAFFHIRKPSLRGSIAARTSVKRLVRSSLGLKAPRGMGWLTNPKKAVYNRLYTRRTVSLGHIFKKLFS
jgi:hypothetical protein